MKKTTGIILALVITALFCTACGNSVKDAPLELSEEKGITGTWAVDATELKESKNPLVSALANMLYGFFEDAAQIEFKEDGKAVIAGKEADYKLADKKLTLTWNGTQNFDMDIAGDGDNIQLSYQGLVTLKLKRIENK